jgi:hypothetical protein
MRCLAIPLALAAVLAAGAAQAAPQAAPICAPASAAKDVEAVVRGWFGAFGRNDYQAGYALQAPGFYAYDNGQRYDGTTLGELLRTAKASGLKVEWNIGAVDVHAGCDEAWAAWVNKGSAGAPGAVEPVTWLESAGLRYQDGHWRMEFLNSSRVPPPNQSPASQPARGRHQRG